jgi:hypothetical protein
MVAMTNIALATPAQAKPFWTLIYTSAGAVTANVHNRTPDSDVLIRVNGNAGTVNDLLDAAAELLRPFATVALSLASGDLVFARLPNNSPVVPITGRVTVRV